MLRILFVVPYKEMEDTVKQVFDEVVSLRKEEISYDIQQGITGEVLEIEPDKTDVVIARGFTAAQMKTSLPKIELQISAFDMMKSVRECQKRFSCSRIAFIGPDNMVFGADSINEVVDSVEVIGRYAADASELEMVMDELVEEGVDVVIGGNSLAECAQRKGIPYVLQQSGKETVYQAVDEAISAMKFSQREKEKREYLQAIMDYSFEGIVSTDGDGKILSVNRFAIQKLRRADGSRLKVSGDLIGHFIEEFLPDICLKGKEENMLSRLVAYGRSRYMVNCIQLTNKEENEGWIVTFRDVENIQEDEGRIRKQLHKKGLFARYCFEDVIGNSRIMKETIQIAKKYARTDSNVFIRGETGTGKELFAQSIHNYSNRKNGPFVAVNCAALPESLLESELFGYVEGAFTGAVKGGKAGLFELAHNGTLFLDEIGEMAINLQARLLRVIQEKEIRRLGGDQVIPVNVRIISASNKDMKVAVVEGAFRQDLLYRIDVLRLELPPLRNRGKDVLELTNKYIDQEYQKTGVGPKGIDGEVQKWILENPWDGNVRELKNFCERLCVLCENELAGVEDVIAASGAMVRCDNPVRIVEFNTNEKTYIEQILKEHGYSRKETAAALNIDTSTLWRKMKKYKIKL